MAEHEHRATSWARSGLAGIVLGLAASGFVLAAEIRTLEVDRHDARYVVLSDTFIDAPVDAVYTVLTDYEHFDRISSIFKESRFLERAPDGSGVVYTRARGCILFFCKTIERTERLDVVPNAQIVATVIPERSDPDFSRAVWALQAEGSGTHVRYELEMDPGFWVPPLIGPLLIKRTLRERSVGAADRVEVLARETAFAARAD